MTKNIYACHTTHYTLLFIFVNQQFSRTGFYVDIDDIIWYIMAIYLNSYLFVW